MRIFAKLLTANEICPFLEVVALRSTVKADYNSKIFYVTADTTQKSWGLAFVMRDGYKAERPTDIGLSVGSKDGYVYWVSVNDRPTTYDYFFDVTKDGKVTDTYRVVYII